MSDYRTTITATWPYTPRGVTVEMRVEETYELSGVAACFNECVTELWEAGTLTGKIAAAIAKLVGRVTGLFRK